MFNYRVGEWKMLIDKFENFKVKFQKVYLDEKMNQLRMLRFVKKMEDDVMDQFNDGKTKIHFNPNRYADYFDYELKAILMSKNLMELKRQDANLKNEKQIKTKSSNDYVFE
uniref:Uncharacterized protein n=1 Tax=Rhabditophanes sp. KR3021 TaxID=114890 RepID=A0AC35TZ28_9BILA